MEQTVQRRNQSLFRDVQVSLAAVAVIIGALYVLIEAADATSSRASSAVLLTFVPSAALCFVALLIELRRRPYSLHLMHILAVAVLLVLAPLVQYLTAFPGPVLLSESEVIRANLCVLLWLTSYVAGETYLRRRRVGINRPLPILESNLSLASLRLGTVFAVLCLGYLAYRGTMGATTRAAFGAAFGAESTMEMASMIVLRGLPMIVLAAWLCLLYLLPSRRTRWAIGATFVLLCANLVVNNPLAAARIWTLTIVLALVCVVYLRKKTNGALLVPGVVIGLMAMPLLNVGRYESEFDLQALRRQTGNVSFGSGDFDAFLNLALMNRLVDIEGTTGGRQLLGAILFWVPRRFWAEKPTGSGFYLAGKLDLAWDNISAPLPAEAVINFGMWGIAPAALLFAGLLYVADSRYYTNRDGAPPEKLRLLDCLYPFWLGLTIFATRGDLINSFAFVGGTSLAAVLALRVFNFPRTLDST